MAGMDDDGLTLSPDYRPEPSRKARGGRERWESLDSRLDRIAASPDYDPYGDTAPARPRRERRSRPVLAIFLIGCAGLAVAYAAAPLLAFRAVRSAAEFGDVQALTELVDYNAVRQSLRVQIRPASVERAPPPSLLQDPLGAIRRAMEPATPQADVNIYLSPEALASLAAGRGMNGPKTAPGRGLFGGPIPRIAYWGFDRTRLGVADPANSKRETIFTFEHGKAFAWRLAAVRLPEETP
jgi:hypothetical protein